MYCECGFLNLAGSVRQLGYFWLLSDILVIHPIHDFISLYIILGRVKLLKAVVLNLQSHTSRHYNIYGIIIQTRAAGPSSFNCANNFLKVTDRRTGKPR